MRAAAVAANIVVCKKGGVERCGWLLHTTLFFHLAPHLLLALDAALGACEGLEMWAYRDKSSP